MSFNPLQEMSLYRQIASAIGGTLEDVCNLQEEERQELITVLGLVVEKDDYLDSYQVDSLVMERSKYRSRMEKEMDKGEGKVPALECGYGDASIAQGTLREVLEKFDQDVDVNNNDEDTTNTSDEDTNSTTSVTGGNVTNQSRHMMVVVKQSDSLTCTDIISDLQAASGPGSQDTPDKKSSGHSHLPSSSHSHPTQPKARLLSKLSLRRKGRNISVTKPSQSMTNRSINSEEYFVNLDKIQQASPQPVPSLLIQRLSSHISAGLDLLSSSTKPSPCPSNLIVRLLSCQPLPVQAVLARQDLPLHHDGLVTVGGGKGGKYREELGHVHKNILEMKSRGLVHAGTGRPDNWGKHLKLSGMKEVQLEHKEEELGRRTRLVKASSLKASSNGTWSSEDKVERNGGGVRKVKDRDEDWQPTAGGCRRWDGGSGESEIKRKRGGKRRLFSKIKDFMDDSAESCLEEESQDEDERRRKYSGTRKGVLRTVEKLKKEGSLTDLCRDDAAS